MFQVKEAALREKIDSFRIFLDSNYHSSHSKLSDKLTDLGKDVNSLKGNLSKNVRKVVGAKNKSEQASSSNEGKAGSFFFCPSYQS
jgi:hypothetical protein